VLTTGLSIWVFLLRGPRVVFFLARFLAKQTDVVFLGLYFHRAIFHAWLLGAAGTLALAEKHVLCQGGPGGGERDMEAVREDKPPCLAEQLWAGLDASDSLRDPDGGKEGANAEWTCPRRTPHPR
jgi:hypothetical protein